MEPIGPPSRVKKKRTVLTELLLVDVAPSSLAKTNGRDRVSIWRTTNFVETSTQEPISLKRWTVMAAGGSHPLHFFKIEPPSYLEIDFFSFFFFFVAVKNEHGSLRLFSETVPLYSVFKESDSY